MVWMLLCLEEFLSVLRELEVLVRNLLKGELSIGGKYLLSIGADNIKEELIKDLDTNGHGVLYLIIGNGKGLIPCNLQKILTNNIYIYSYNNSTFKICNLMQSSMAFGQNDFEIIKNAVDIPFYMKWFGYDRLHLELFGNYPHFSDDKVKDNIAILPIGSTLVITAATEHAGVRKVVDELISISHTTSIYEENPYFRFLKYLIYNPDNNFIFLKLKTETKLFSTDINEISDFSDLSIITWQQAQIKKFVNFYFQIINHINEKIELKFYNFINNDLFEKNSYDDLKMPLIETQERNIEKYKELLLFNLISKNESKKIEAILNTGININCHIKSNVTPIHVAVALGQKNTVELLIKYGANIDITNKNKFTPLMEASKNNFVQIIDLLFNNDAHVDAKDIGDNTALILAACFEQYEAVEILLNNNVDLNHINKKNESALTCAIKKNNFIITKLLLSYAANSKFLDDINYYQNYEISNDIKEEIEKFEIDPVHYILQSHHSVIQADKALNSLKSYDNSEEYIAYINSVQERLQSNFALDVSYNNLLEVYYDVSSYIATPLKDILNNNGECIL